jgi:hypothetical protein
MIGWPLNDRACLDQMTMRAAHALRRPDIGEAAGRFASTGALASWIRGLPQRDDEGAPADGPKVACDVPQRARVNAPDPNCVERALLYVAVAERINARPLRQLATIDTPVGRHTLVVENGEPVLLDPRQTRNALDAGLWQQVSWRGDRRGPRNAGSSAPEHVQLVRWILRAAEEPAQIAGDLARGRVANAGLLLTNLIGGAPLEELRRSQGAKQDVGYLLDLASTVAPLWGPAGVTGVAVARQALGSLGLTAAPANEAQPKGSAEPRKKG